MKAGHIFPLSLGKEKIKSLSYCFQNNKIKQLRKKSNEGEPSFHLVVCTPVTSPDCTLTEAETLYSQPLQETDSATGTPSVIPTMLSPGATKILQLFQDQISSCLTQQPSYLFLDKYGWSMEFNGWIVSPLAAHREMVQFSEVWNTYFGTSDTSDILLITLPLSPSNLQCQKGSQYNFPQEKQLPWYFWLKFLLPLQFHFLISFCIVHTVILHSRVDYTQAVKEQHPISKIQ